jgi:RNA polymerase sigma factor (TIGR02999 family)
MVPPLDDDFERLLQLAQSGDIKARDQLVELIYQDLHKIARQRMRRERPDHTLQTTALLNEALAKILSDGTLSNATGQEFFHQAASRAMERILIDHNRGWAALKRFGRRNRTPLDAGHDQLAEVGREPEIDLIEAIQELEHVDMRAAWVVRYRFVLDLSISDVAIQLGISQRTVERDWRFARAWLRNQFEPPDST